MEPDGELLDALMSASRALVGLAAISIEASPVEVTLVQYRALVVIAGQAPLSMAALGAAVAMSPSSTTRLVERLERKGLVARGPSATSRRVVELRLEPAGAALVEAVMAERRRSLARLIEGVPPRRRDAMRRAFEDFARLAGEPLAPPAPLSPPPMAAVPD